MSSVSSSAEKTVEFSPSDSSKPELRIEVVQSLRGIAAAGVVWFHFTNGNPHFLPAGLLKTSGTYGWVGVDVFFVISGFILPYSLFRARYLANTLNYGRFLLKRVTRLDPPYLASIVIVLVLAKLSSVLPGFRGVTPSFPWKPLWLHLGYLNAFYGAPWLNVVYWSLAIEFQYYLLVGLLFPLIRSESRAIRLALLGALGVSAFAVTNGALVFHYFFLFILGFAAFLSRTAVAQRWEALAILGIASLGAVLTVGGVSALAGIATSVVILTVEGSNWALALLGELSYSLYLVHVPVGGRVINLGERLGGGWVSKLAWLAAATVLSLLAAYALYHFVERPCRRYAGSLRYKKT
jgi:peptidoglycan/LPS O-acetylase OafA/YrhL